MKKLLVPFVAGLFLVACTETEPKKTEEPVTPPAKDEVVPVPAPATTSEAKPAPAKKAPPKKKHKKKKKTAAVQSSDQPCSVDALNKAREEGRQQGLKEASSTVAPAPTTTP